METTANVNYHRSNQASSSHAAAELLSQAAGRDRPQRNPYLALFFAGDLVFKVKKIVRLLFWISAHLPSGVFISMKNCGSTAAGPLCLLRCHANQHDENGWRWASGGRCGICIGHAPLAGETHAAVLLETKQVTVELMRELAAALARFHLEAPRAEGHEPGLYPVRLEKQWNDNLRELEPLVDSPISRAQLDTVNAFGADFLARNRELLRQRAEQGWIRDVHGICTASISALPQKEFRYSTASNLIPAFAVAILRPK